MIDHEPDLEVLADLALRDASERDRTRSRTANYDWRPSVPVAVWHCRLCRRYTDVYQEQLDALATFDAKLASMGESPLDTSKIAYCERCVAELRESAPRRRRAQVDRMAVAIRELKACDNPERERDIVASLESMGHPDVKGLVEAIASRKRTPSNRRTL